MMSNYAVAFIILMLSHIVVLLIGYRMGKATQTEQLFPATALKSKPYHDQTDPYDEERLDML